MSDIFTLYVYINNTIQICILFSILIRYAQLKIICMKYQRLNLINILEILSVKADQAIYIVECLLSLDNKVFVTLGLAF